MKKLVLLMAVVAVALLSGCRANDVSARKQFHTTQWQANKHISFGRFKVEMGMSDKAAFSFMVFAWGILPALILNSDGIAKKRYKNSTEQFVGNTMEYADEFGPSNGIKVSPSTGKGHPDEGIWVKEFFAYNHKVPYMVDVVLTIDYNHRSEMRNKDMEVSYQWDIYDRSTVKVVTIFTRKQLKIAKVAIESDEYMATVSRLQRDNVRQLFAVLSKVGTSKEYDKPVLRAWDIL